jgi:hypothetical protein
LRKHDLAFGKFAIRIVGALDIRPQIAGKVDDLAAGLEASSGDCPNFRISENGTVPLVAARLEKVLLRCESVTAAMS